MGADGVLQLLGPSAGGIRRHVAALTAELRRRGRPIDVAGPPGVMEGLIPLDHVVTVPARARPLTAVRAARAVRAIGEGRILHAHGLKAGAVALAGRRGRPVVVTIHNLVLDEVAGASAWWQRHLEQEVVIRADQVIAVSDEMAGRLARADIAVIPPVAPAPVVERGRDEVRRALGVSDEDPLVVCVARLHPQKDLPTLVAGVPALLERMPRAQVRIVGDGPERSRLADAIVRAGVAHSVALAGPSPNGADEMAAADVVVLSSLWEGNPVVIGEAMRLGRPVVATDVGAVSMLIRDGVTGRLVPPRAPDLLGCAIADVLLDPTQTARLVEAATHEVEERLGTDVLVDAVERVYDEAAS